MELFARILEVEKNKNRTELKLVFVEHKGIRDREELETCRISTLNDQVMTSDWVALFYRGENGVHLVHTFNGRQCKS